MNAFRPILERLIEWNGQHFGGDVSEDLQRALREAMKAETGHDNQLGDILFVASFSRFAERAAFDLGLMEACPSPADGEVVVHGGRVRALLAVLESWSDETARPADPAPESAWFEIESALDDNGSYWSPSPVKHPTYESALDAARTDMGLFGCTRIVYHHPGMKVSVVVKLVRREM